MKKLVVSILITTLILAINCNLPTVNNLYAESFKILGSRPLGMGGAFVAVAEDTLAQYWNPAGLAKQKLFDLQAPFNGGAKLTGGILKEAKDISDAFTKIQEIQSDQANGQAIDQRAILNFYTSLRDMNDLGAPGLGALIEIPASLAIRIGRTSWQLNNFTEIGLKPSLDLQNIGLKATSSGNGTILANSVGIKSPASLGAITFSTNTLDQSFFADPSTSTEVLASRDQLAGIITDLSVFLKADLTGVTTTQVANALIKIAQSSFNYTNDQIIQTTDEIVTLSNELKDAGILTTGTYGGFSNNQTKLTLRGVSILEVSAAYGQPLAFISKDLLAGVNFKIMRGYIGFGEIGLMSGESTDLNSMLTDYTKNVKESYNFGVDLGLMFDKKESWRTRIGILARNINSPSFDQPDAAGGGKYSIDPQIRAGIALFPLKGFFGWLIACDYDLTKNSTLLEGYDSQLLSVGTELHLGGKTWFNVAVRAGAMKNLAEEDEMAYTAGLGMNFLHFQFDLAGAISKDKTEIEAGKEFPSSAQVSGTLTFNF